MRFVHVVGISNTVINQDVLLDVGEVRYVSARSSYQRYEHAASNVSSY
jgi:hypothetical protein